MSAGNFAGSLLNSVLFLVIWLVAGWVISSFGDMFNRGIQMFPTFQDAATGFNITQTAYVVLLVFGWMVIWVNYAINEHNEANQVV